MSEQQASYRQIMKATSIFGGVQVFQILIQIIRSKFVAIYLGPAGMGIVGLLTSTTGLISSLTNFGLGTSAVRNIAEAHNIGNNQRIAMVVTVVQRLVWITGLLGAILTAILSPWLSKLTFGNADYTISFIWISITLLFSQVSSGQLVLLQGLRKLQYLAKANLYGAVVGLLITVPIYYKFGEKGIVPVIIFTSVISLFFTWYFTQKLKISSIKVNKIRTIAESKSMLRMGIMLSLSGLLTLATSYILRIFITKTGGVADVGLYNAGFTIITTYVGLVFTAMGTDYYPRLAAAANVKKSYIDAVNQQADIALLILAPIIMVFLVFINWAVILLYSEQFTPINNMIHWAALGMLFRTISWAIAFLFLAKGESKLFFLTELISNTYFLILNLFGYYFWGLSGLGVSFLLGYIFYLIHVFLVAKIKYQFEFQKSFIILFSIILLLTTQCFIVMQIIKQPYNYIIGSIFILISTIFAYRELDKRIGIKSIISKFILINK